MFLHLDWSVANSIDWLWEGTSCLYKRSNSWKYISVQCQRGKNSASLKVSNVAAVVSIILKWNKFGTARTLPRPKLSNGGRRALVREVSKKGSLRLSSRDHMWKWEKPAGQPSLQLSTDLSFTAEWPDGHCGKLYSSKLVKRDLLCGLLTQTPPSYKPTNHNYFFSTERWLEKGNRVQEEGQPGTHQKTMMAANEQLL